MPLSTAVASEQMPYIYLLGGLRIVYGDISIDDSLSRTRQVWTLLGYLITFRHKTVSQETLYDLLWPDGKSDNPANALKNLIYRIRSILSSSNIPNAKDLILFRGGTYCWNNSIDCFVDIEQFEKLKEQADNTELSDQERIELYNQAIDLYKGDFMASSAYDDWVVPMISYYRSLYFRCVRDLGSLLLNNQQFVEVTSLSQKAMTIDQFEEMPHKLLIFSFVKQGKHQEALNHYRFVDDLFFRELGVTPSESMRKLYSRITKNVQNIQTDLGLIKDSLAEEDANGAFFCDYEVFKNVYKLEARAASRAGHSVFLALITVVDKLGATPAVEVLAPEMDRLMAIIHASLRKGDVVSRFSPSQYILLLPMLSYESGQVVLRRITLRYDASNHSPGIKLISTLHPMSPVV